MPENSAQHPRTPTGATNRTRTKDTGPPSTGADEKATLRGFLDYLRNSVADKVASTPEPHVRESGVPSGTSLLGLLKHLASVERFAFLGEDADDWRATMRPSTEDTVDGVLADYRKSVERANEVIDACPDLTLPAPRPARRGPGPSMRWILVHMIEETGRHAGHADILRERIDGSTGR
ncbi:DinB family protein [Streptomyces sp. NPDC054796]